MEGMIRFSVRNRLIIILMIIVIAVAGVMAFMKLPVEAFPDVLNEVVQVITLAPGQSAEDVEKKITIPLEKEFSGVPRVAKRRSISEFGLSVIYLYYEDGVDKYWARSQVLEKIQTADIPANLVPRLAPMASVTGEVLRYEVKGSRYSPTQLRTIQEWTLEKQFRMVPGVADVVSYGGKVRAFEVEMDPLKLTTYGVSVSSLADSISSSNQNAGGNMIQWPNQSFVVRSDGEIRTVSDIENVGIAQKNSSIIRVKDIAIVKESFRTPRGIVGKDSKDDIIQGIVLLRKGENPAIVGAALREKINMLNLSTILPDGIHITPFYDRVELVTKTIKTVGKNLTEGLILIIVVLFIFLRNKAATAIVAGVVLLSVALAFIVMNMVGTPVNLISLGSIDFGIIIDGAVVIIEYLLMKNAMTGLNSDEFIEQSVNDVAKPVVFSMSMIILAYLPIFTLQQVEGKMFTPLAWTITFILCSALFMSLFVVPAFLKYVCSTKHDLGHHDEPEWLLKCKKYYEGLLSLAMSKQNRVFQLAALGGVVSLICFNFAGSEFIPELDEGAYWIRATYPHSMNLEEGTKMARSIREELRKNNPEIESVVSQLGGPEDGTDPNLTDNCEFFIDMKPKESWKRFGGDHSKFAQHLREELAQFVGVEFNVSQPIADNVEEAVSGVKGKNAVKIFGYDLKTLYEIAHELSKRIKSVEGAADVGVVAAMPMTPQLTIRVDRARVAQLGLNISDVNALIQTAVGGKQVTDMYEGETKVAIIVRSPERFRSSISDISNLPLMLPNGNRTRLGTVADVKIEQAPQVINREEGFRRIAVKFNAEGRDLGSMMKDVLKAVSDYKPPTGYFLEWGGEYENQKRAMKRLSVVIPATMLLLAIVMFLLFAEMGAVVCMLLTMLLSISGSVLLLFVRGIPFSVPAAVGLLALLGLVTLDGVTLTTTAIRKRKEGLSILDACSERFRPILMVSVLAALGFLPAAISHGIGSETQKPLATAVIGGVFTSMPSVLIFLPVMLNFIWKRKSLKESIDIDLK